MNDRLPSVPRPTASAARLLAVILLAALPGAARATEPAATIPDQPLFTRHVVPLFSRLGCNAGACHGAVKGQGGFRLSLFGADPATDHRRLLHDFGGRRVNRAEPGESLLLLKAAGRVPHAGGVRAGVGTPEYQTLLRWTSLGTKLDDPAKSRVTALTTTPAQQVAKTGESYPLRVQAKFADGTAEDVTWLCTFESGDKGVAEVDEAGRVRVVGVGDTTLVARYRGQPVATAVFSPAEAKGPFPDVKPHNFIDKHVLDKLGRMNTPPADLCDDATFLRRASLDVTGLPPTPDEVRAFLADKSPDKRAKKIDELLARPGYAALWATKFCDLLKPTGYNPNWGTDASVDPQRVHAWLRARFAENTPYDELVERILTATSREGRPLAEWVTESVDLCRETADPSLPLDRYASRRTLDLIWQRNYVVAEASVPIKAAVQVSHAFLGLRLECAQCHRHPSDVWQQEDLLDFANFFSRVSSAGGSSRDPEVQKAAKALKEEEKKLSDQLKVLEKKVQDKKLPKEEADKLNKEIAKLRAEVRARNQAANRVQNAEIHNGAKYAATVSSPIGNQRSDRFRLLGDSAPVAVPAGKDPRPLVMAWLRKPDNPFFAKTIVNRVWAHYFGRGIVDPPDQLSPLNPPSHPELLDELAAEFVKHKYDLKWLHRTILASRTYQQSSTASGPAGRADARNYARAYLRRLPAEVLVDTVNQTVGGEEKFPPVLRLPPGSRVIELAGVMKLDGKDKAGEALLYALHVFGRSPRNPDVQCDCERDSSPSIAQMLFLTNHPVVRAKVADDKGRVAQIVRDQPDAARRVEEVFLWALGRPPGPAEMKAAQDYVNGSASARKGLEGLMQTLLRTDEFILNH